MPWDATPGGGFTTGQPWYPFAPGKATANVAAQTGDPGSPLSRYRNLIRARLEEVGGNFQWHEVNGQHAFLRDEGPRYDPALAYHCYGLVFELFHRRLGSGDLAD